MPPPAAANGLRARPLGQVGAGQVGRAADEFGQHRRQPLDRVLRGLARGDRFGLGVDLLRAALRSAPSRSAGSSPAMRRRNSRGELREGLFVGGEALVPVAAPAAAPARARVPGRRRPPSGTSNGGWVQPIAARVAATSSSPSGAPCALAVPACFGDPLPITVLQQIRLGRFVSALAARIARVHRVDVVAVDARESRASRRPRSAWACRR